jgi:hypothetical protein
MFILLLLVQGAIFGVVLRAILPGEQQWTIGRTVGVGVVAWLLLGLVWRAIFGAVVGLVMTLLIFGSALLVLGGVYLFLGSRRGSGARRR